MIHVVMHGPKSVARSRSWARPRSSSGTGLFAWVVSEAGARSGGCPWSRARRRLRSVSDKARTF